MAKGILADRNRAPTGAVDETGWSLTSPAANALRLPLGVRARALAIGTAGAPVVLKGTFDGRYPITYAGLFDTNLRQAGAVRLRLYADTSFTDVLFDTRDPATGLDRRVIPSLYDWRQLRWGDPNLLRGDLPPEDYALYPSNVHVVVPLCRPVAYRWDLVDVGYDRLTGADAGYLEIGHAWLSDSIPFEVNYSFGGADSWNPTDEVKRTPGGLASVSPGVGYRSAEIPLNLVTRADSDRLFDLAKRVNCDRPVVWLPNVDKPDDLFRYGFAGQRRGAHRRGWHSHRFDTSTLQLEEITT